MKREFVLKKSPKGFNKIIVEIVLEEDKQGRPVFSATGEVWEHGVCVRAGQCLSAVSIGVLRDERKKDPKYKKRAQLIRHIYSLWLRNHLNNLHAGTPEQEDAIKEWRAGKEGNYDYSTACEHLKSIGLYTVPHPDFPDGYKYGHAWLYREISEEDLMCIHALLGMKDDTYDPD